MVDCRFHQPLFYNSHDPTFRFIAIPSLQRNFLFLCTNIIVAAVAEYSGKLVTGQGFVSKYVPVRKESCAACFNKNVLPAVEKFTVCAESRVKSIIYGENLECTLKAAGLCYINYKLTSWFSIFTLLVIAVVAVFTVPTIYLGNRKEIDAAIQEHTKVLRAKTCELTKQAQKTIEPYINLLIEKSGPVGNFVKTQFPKTRTAGSTVGDSKSTKYNISSDSSVGPKVAVPTSAKTTGASQFPNVPSSTLNNKNDVDQIASDIVKEHN